MSRRGFLLGTILMSLLVPISTLVVAKGPDHLSGDSKRVEENEVWPPGPEPLAIPGKDKVINSAYRDAFSILSGNNPCSEFFGGPDVIEVLNGFVGGLQKEYVDPLIGLRMSGLPVNMLNARTNRSYRLFKHMAVNTRGPFYQNKHSDGQFTIHRVGSFEPNTREVRVLMILHELGHLIKGPDGSWLLPDDGFDAELSLKNTRKVESICSEQIRSLGS